MYAFYSLLIYIFYSLFRRDGRTAAAADPGDSTQSARCHTKGRRCPGQPTPHLWTELTCLAGCSESEDGLGGAVEGRPAEVSLEEALTRLAEFLSVHLGAEEGCGNPPDVDKPVQAPPLLTVTSQLLTLLAWIWGPRGRQALLQRTQPAAGVQPPTPDGSPSQEESPFHPATASEEASWGETQVQQPPQLEEEQRAWHRLEQLILGQVRAQEPAGMGVGAQGSAPLCPPSESPAGRAEATAGTAGGGAGPAAPECGGDRLREEGSAPYSGERGPETEPKPNAGTSTALGAWTPLQGPSGL